MNQVTKRRLAVGVVALSIIVRLWAEDRDRAPRRPRAIETTGRES